MNSKENITLSIHVCNTPCPEEVMVGASAKYEVHFVSIPKQLVPKQVLEIIDKMDNTRYISQIALLKD